MRKMTTNLVRALEVVGVVAVDVKWVMPEGDEAGGYIVRVATIRDLDRAELVAAKFQQAFGFEVLVAF